MTKERLGGEARCLTDAQWRRLVEVALDILGRHVTREDAPDLAGDSQGATGLAPPPGGHLQCGQISTRSRQPAELSHRPGRIGTGDEAARMV